MSTDHTARPENWDEITRWAATGLPLPTTDCLLELRARVERLEQAQQPEPEPTFTAEEVELMQAPWSYLASEKELQQPPAPSTPHAAIEVLRDAISALRYIEQGHGRLYGVGWDRVFDAAAPFLAAEPAPSAPAGQRELVRSVAALIADFASASRVGDDCTPAAKRSILAVADWLSQFAFIGPVAALRREVKR